MTQLQDLTLEEAQQAVIGTARVVGTENLAVTDALGRVLRQNIVADVDVPEVDLSSVDGYCLNAPATAPATSGSPVLFNIEGTIRAGVLPRLSLRAGQCAHIMTGGILPEGADAVAKTEEVQSNKNRVSIAGPIPSGQHVRKAGEIVRAGDVVLEEGCRITPTVAGLLTGITPGMVKVSRKPRVGVFATGDELVLPGESLDPGKSRSSNTIMIRSLLESLICEVLDVGISRDREADIIRHIEECAACDAVVTTGGVSGGKYDLMPSCLKKMGARVLVRRLCVAPGRNILIAAKGGMVFFCLPGSPVSSLVLFHMIVRPGLLMAMGSRSPLPRALKARLAASAQKVGGLRTLVPSRLRSDLQVEPLGFAGSGDIVGLAAADSITSLDEVGNVVSSGKLVDVFLLDQPASAGAS